MVVMTGPSGGGDLMARRLVEIIEGAELLGQPINIVNLPQGYGAAAFQRVVLASDPDHVLLVTMNSFYTTPLLQPGLRVDIMDFKPIAQLAEDTFYLWVRADAPFDSLDGFANLVRLRGEKWVMAGTGVGGADEILTEYLNLAMGLTMSYRGLKSGADAANALVLGRADSTLNNLSEARTFLESGRVRPMAVFLDDRSDHLPNVASLIEYDYGFSYTMQRGIAGGPGMSPEAVAYYSALFKSTFDTPEWTAFREEQALDGAHLSGEALRESWGVQRERHERLLKAMGRLP